MSLFKQALADALETTGKSSAQLADEIGVGRSRISEFTSGKSLPKDDTIVSICNAFGDGIARHLSQAWVRERLKDRIADLILASDTLGGTELERLYCSLPSSTAQAFLILMQTARDDEDFRGSLEQLAAFVTPDEASQSPGAQKNSESATAAASSSSPPAELHTQKDAAKAARFRQHITPEPDLKVAEPAKQYTARKKKNGTDG